MGTLDGKRALVTEAETGIGQGIAIDLARHGASVAVHSGTSERGVKEAVAEVERLDGRAWLLQADLSRADSCVAVVDRALACLGGLDVVVKNAGRSTRCGILEVDEKTYRATFDLNMQGYFFCAQRAVTHMLPHRRDGIVNITSVHARAGRPNTSVYAATKGAVVSFTQALAVQLADHRIRVNGVGPGVVEVPRYVDVSCYTTAVGDSRVPIGESAAPPTSPKPCRSWPPTTPISSPVRSSMSTAARPR